jgi:hypothetical protein
MAIPIRALFFSGVVISNLLYVFIMGFLLKPWLQVDPYEGDISLIIFGHIFFTTFMSSAAGYFWSVAGLSLKTVRRAAPANALITMVPFVLHAGLLEPFFMILAVIILLFCSQLGVWFGRRFFYE